MIFMNESQTVYLIIEGLTNDVTGSLFLTLLLVYLLVMGIAIVLRMEIEYTAIFLLPLSLVLMAYSGEFMAIGFVTLLYLGFIMAKNFFIK